MSSDFLNCGRSRSAASPAWLAAAVVLAAGCSGPSSAIPKDLTKPPPKSQGYSAAEALRQFDAVPDPEYRLGEGDILSIQVWDRPDLSVAQVIGPDGAI
ncbi:MAG TPA: polysaccharide biosynthesis/export family protein, partial [Planctomycetota bacterium]|nr:polysaccharide biosynthesis/export family protein [Planctomycetota bacterium]